MQAGDAPPQQDIQILSLAAGVKQRFHRDQTIFNQGDEARFVYRVVRGGARLCRVRANGRRQIVGFVLPGDLFGFEQADHHSLTAETLCASSVLTRYTRARIECLADASADARHEIRALLHHEISQTQQHLVLLGRTTAKERLATFLLQLAARAGATSGQRFDVPMSRQDMADYLGLTLETVCRAVTMFKRNGLLIAPDRKHLVIANLDELADVSEGEEA